MVRGIAGRALTANIVNATVGSGIFVLPAAVAAILGPASVLAYLLCALFMGVVGLCFAESSFSPAAWRRWCCDAGMHMSRARRSASPADR